MIEDGSGNGNDAAVVGGEDWHAGYLQFNGENHVKLPDGLLAGQTAATIVLETTPERLAGAQFLWNIGGSGNAATGQFFVQPVDPRVSISRTNYSAEQTALSPTKLVADRWQSIAATIARNLGTTTSTLRFYVDGVLRAEKTDSTTNLDDLTTHTMNYLGRSAYSGDGLYEGKVTTARIYTSALTATELATLAAQDAPVAAAETVAGIDLDAANTQDLSAIETDMVLPVAGSVTWSAAPAGIVAADGASPSRPSTPTSP